MSETWLLRIGILAAGLILMVAIIWFGRPKKAQQGRRFDRSAGPGSERAEPTLGEAMAGSAHEGTQDELDLDSRDNDLGKRVEDSFDKIVSLFVAARAG